MGKENTGDLKDWIEKGVILESEKKDVELTIKAFSDYLTAVDPEYKYNKSFLKDFIPDFIKSNEMLIQKKEFLEKLVESLEEYKENLRIEIDNAWIFDGTKGQDKIILSNVFSKGKVNSGKIHYQLKYNEKYSFVIAGSIDIDSKKANVDKIVGEVANLFLSRVDIKNENK